MPKLFTQSINPITRKTSLFSPLPGAYFKQNPSPFFHENDVNELQTEVFTENTSSMTLNKV